MATLESLSSTALVREISQVGRKMRKPQHSFNIRCRPYQIQPTMIAPVLPGETMKNLLLQARVVTDPIKNPLVGWWQEFYVFYVKLRDLPERDAFTEMMITPGYSTAALASGPVVNHNHESGINFVKKCLDRVVEEYFRLEGEGANDHLVGIMPSAAVVQESYLDSAKLASAMPTSHNDHVLPGDDVMVLPDHVPAEFGPAYLQWQQMRELKVTEATFDDYLKQFGIRIPKEAREDKHIPELIRYVKDWSYPTNTVNPATGAVASAVSWSIAERADKDRYFTEPGFLFGCSVTRPKVYLGGSKGNVADYLDNAYSWLPALLSDDPYTSLRAFAANEGPLARTAHDTAPVRPMAESYWVDMRDLFLYGDQFSNVMLDGTAPGTNVVLLPTANMNKRYPASADIDAFFAAAGGTVRMDGVHSLQILGRQKDST